MFSASLFRVGGAFWADHCDIDARNVEALTQVLKAPMKEQRMKPAPSAPVARMLVGRAVDLSIWVACSESPNASLKEALEGLEVLLMSLEVTSEGRGGL